MSYKKKKIVEFAQADFCSIRPKFVPLGAPSEITTNATKIYFVQLGIKNYYFLIRSEILDNNYPSSRRELLLPY